MIHNFIERLINFWRGLTLTPSFAYHDRNFAGNVASNELAKIETQFRVDLYNRLRKKGMPAEDAWKIVAKSLFDYEDKL